MVNKEELFKMIKKMTPGDVMTFVAHELGVNPAELLAKNAGSIALKAVKAGWAKAGGIKDAVKGFSDKTKTDDTGIDWDNVEVEEAGFKMSCLFDGDSGKKLKEFVKKLSDQMKEFAEEEKKVNEVELLTEGAVPLKEVAKNAVDSAADKALSGAKNFKQMQAAFEGLDSDVKKEIEDLMKQGPQGALKAADKLGKLAGGNAAAQQVLDKMMEKQEWYENASSDMKNALNSDMYSLSIQSKGLDDVMSSGDVAHAAGGDAVSDILADKAKTPKEAVAAAGASKDAAKEMANDEEMKKQAAEKAGVKAFTPLGWARLAAKTTGYVLNHSKDVIDALGAKKIAKGEDKDVIAEIRTQVENAESSDKDYSDSEFSVRFTVGDFKWHATCIDDRKMQVPEDILVKKVLGTDTGKKFKEYCLKKWKSMFGANPDGEYAMLPFILGNIDKFGLKGGNDEFFKKVKAVADNIDKIEQQFK